MFFFFFFGLFPPAIKFFVSFQFFFSFFSSFFFSHYNTSKTPERSITLIVFVLVSNAVTQVTAGKVTSDKTLFSASGCRGQEQSDVGAQREPRSFYRSTAAGGKNAVFRYVRRRPCARYLAGLVFVFDSTRLHRPMPATSVFARFLLPTTIRRTQE